MIIVRLCARFSWEIMTPFGSDVEPDVYCRNAKSVGFGAADGAAAGAAVAPVTLGNSSTMTHSSSGHLASFENMFFRSACGSASMAVVSLWPGGSIGGGGDDDGGGGSGLGGGGGGGGGLGLGGGGGVNGG